MSAIRLVRVKRGHPPLQIHPMKSKEEFCQAWDRRMRGYTRETKYDTGTWGLLNCEELFNKLTEISKGNVMKDLSNYRAWYDHFFPQIPSIHYDL